MTRPVIGVTTDLRTQEHTTYHVLDDAYCAAILEAGATPRPIASIDPKAIREVLYDLAGLVIAHGTGDPDPRRYGQKQHPATRLMHVSREDRDRALIIEARRRKLPLIAIDSGLLLLNLCFRGTIYQHLPDELPRAMDHYDRHDHLSRHGVEVLAGTRFDELYAGVDHRVPSRHHQAVKRVADGFQSSMLAPDGIIEAIESTDPDWFCLGVQWRPIGHESSRLDAALFDALVQACGVMA